MAKVNGRLKKKAMVFTISLLLIATLVFSLSIILKSTTDYGSERFSLFTVQNRVYDLSMSVTKNLEEIIKKEKVILSENIGNMIRLKERLGDTTANSFNITLINYKDFIEDDPNIKLDIDGMLSDLSFVIQPNNITYSHNKSNSDTISISPGASSYFITIETEKDVQGCVWQAEEGSFSIRIKVIDDEGVACDETNTINPDKSNIIKIQDNRYMITLDNGGELNIKNNKLDREDIDVIVEISLDSAANEIITGKNIVYVEFSSFNISKSSAVSLS